VASPPPLLTISPIRSRRRARPPHWSPLSAGRVGGSASRHRRNAMRSGDQRAVHRVISIALPNLKLGRRLHLIECNAHRCVELTE